MCFTNPSNDQLVKDEGVQIFYSIRSQTKFIGIGENCEIPHKLKIKEMHIEDSLIVYDKCFFF